MKLTIKDGRDHFYTFDTNRILLLTATDEDMIKQVEFSTEENGEEVSWTSEVLTGEDGIKFVQVPNEFLNGDYSRLVCYYVALDSKGEYTRQKEIFRIRARQEPEDYYLTYSERITFASIKALTEQYKSNASNSAELASKYAENNEDVAVESGKYSAKHWSIKSNKKYEEIRSYVGSASDPESALGSIESARANAVSDVEKQETDSIEAVGMYTSNTAIHSVSQYVDGTAKPALKTYGEQQVDSYVNGTSKPELDRYVNNEKKQVLDNYTAEKKSELDNYTETDKKHVLDNYTENEKKAELDSHTAGLKEQLNAHTVAKSGDLNEYTTGLKSELDGYTTAKEQDISEFTEQKKSEVQGVYQSDLNELKGDLFNITSEGNYNILDEEFEIGSYGSYGVEEDSTTRLRTKNYIPCKSNTNYWFNTNGYGVFIYWFDENKNYIGITFGTDNLGVKDECITSKANAKFFRFRTNNDYGTTYKKDFCVRQSDVYVPYIPHRISNDIFARDQIDFTNERINHELELNSLKPLDFMRFENVNSILNGGQAIQDNIITRNGYQFCCYVNGENKACIAKRSVDNHEWVHRVIDAFPVDVKLDGHYYLSMGMDVEGQIHLVGGEHCSPLRYVRTTVPYDINSFIRMANMIGNNETEVSYPCFVNKKDGGLLFFYRNGGSGETYNYVVNAFVEEQNNHKWLRLSTNLISGNHTDGYPYLNHIVVDKDGKIHISGCWRANENYDVFYMVNDCNGTQTSWKKSDGTPYDSFPITRENAEKICDISTIDNGLLNQNGMCVDENNIPHIVYFRLDENEKTNIFHLYKNGSNWIEQKVTGFEYKVEPNLTSYEGQLSRPSIFCYNNRLYLIYRHNYDGLNGKLRLRDITEYPKYKETVIFDGDLGAYEASYDTNSINNGELNILVCEGNTNINESVPIETRYNEIDWVKKSISGVISIKLDRINDVMNNMCKIPHVRILASGEKIIVKGGAKHYIRLSMVRNSNELAKASAVAIKDNEEILIGSIYLYDTDTEMTKTSNYLLIDYDEDVIVKAVNETSNIECSYLESAELN